MNRKRCVLFFVLLALSVSSLMAQTASTGALTGTIKDPSGAVVPNATVTLTSLDTAQARTATTSAEGTYQFSQLQPGNYRIRIEAAGFKPLEISSVTVSVTETAVLDRNLEVGGQTQSVTVEGEVETIQTTSSALGTVATARTVTETPLNTRNYTNLLAFSTGVSGNVSNATTLGKGATNMAVNGATTGQNTYLQDGVTVNNYDSVGGVSEGQQFGSFAMPNPDAIAEFKIQTSSYDAGYGRNPGANVNVVTKSGTNNFHGDVYEFFRNTVLNANDFFLNQQGVAKPPLNSNIYGGTIGGPIKKDKLFFFASYEENDQKNGFSAFSKTQGTVLAPIPGNAPDSRGTCGPVPFYTIASCNAAGAAFVTGLAQNMCKNNPKNGVQVITCPSAGPGDPSGLFGINPIAINILQLQLPGGAGYLVPGSGTSGFLSQSFVSPAQYKDHQGIGNLDYVINSKNTFSGRYMYESNPLVGNFDAQNSQEAGDFLPGTPFNESKVNQSSVAKLTTIVSNNAVNEFHVAYQRDEALANQDVVFNDQQVGLQPFVSPFTPNAAVNFLPQFTISGNGNGNMTFGYHHGYASTNVRENQFVIGDQISLTRGKHSFRVGFEENRVQNGFINSSSSIGTPGFPTFADFLIGRSACGSDAAGAPIITTPSALNPAGCNGSTTGKASTTGSGGSSAANGIVEMNLRVFQLSSFIQDDIKVNGRFTLNLGVRWELDQYPTENNGNLSNFWPSLTNTAPPPFVTSPGGAGETLAGTMVPSTYTGIIPTGVYQSPLPYAEAKGAPWDNFAPRIGFAWQPTSSNRLVVRAGAGYFYNVLGGHDIARFDLSNPVHGVGTTNSPIASLYNPYAIAPGLVSAGPGNFGFVPRWVDTSTISNNPAAFCPGPPCSSNTATTMFDSNMTVPLTYEWNLNVQYEFLPSWVLEVGYVGSHGIHQASPGAANTAIGADGSPGGIPFNYAQLAGVGAPCVSCSVTPNGVPITTNTTQNAILRVPYLGISPTASYDSTSSNYKYNSLQVTMRKQLSKGLQLQAAYTWARGFEQYAQGVNTYPYIVQSYAPEYFVRPQRLVVSYVWQLPLGHQKGFLGRVTDGWSWSGVTIIQDGQPLDLNDSTAGSIFGAKGGNATLCPGFTAKTAVTSGSAMQRITNGFSGDGWLNSAAFCPAPTIGNGTGFGTMGQGLILGPGQSNWDMSFEKLIKIRETKNLQFRAEFFNIFNHPQFASFLADSDPTDRQKSAGTGGTSNGGNLFGSINATSVNPRVVQFALKFLF
jgi:hypothetical protein